MNMGMNFSPNQGMYPGWNNGQSNNMWQNNNANAFSNGMGGDFGSNYGFNMAQPGNFQQQYPNGDFQNGYSGRGYGRGRGRGRGGYGRGRGNFNQYPQYQQQTYQNGSSQYDSQAMRPQTASSQRNETAIDDQAVANHDATHDDDEFAPGGQDEIQEALGEDYQKSTDFDKNVPDTSLITDSEVQDEIGHERKVVAEDQQEVQVSDQRAEAIPIRTTAVENPTQVPEKPKPIPAAYEEDLQGPMPPPTAPLGPSAQFDYGFRSRGHGRYAPRGRGSMAMQNGHVASQVKPHSLTPLSGTGVVGAPTGPRAMREPPAPLRPASRPASSGFQIMGRAAMASPKGSESRGSDPPTIQTPTSDHDITNGRDDSKRQPRQDKHDASSKYDAENQDDDYQDKEDRQRKASRRDTYDDYDRDSREMSPATSDTVNRRASRRNRSEKDNSSLSKHQDTRSRRHEDASDDREMNDYAESTRS